MFDMEGQKKKNFDFQNFLFDLRVIRPQKSDSVQKNLKNVKTIHFRDTDP